MLLPGSFLAQRSQPTPKQLQKDGWFSKAQQDRCRVLLICTELIPNMMEGSQASKP